MDIDPRLRSLEEGTNPSFDQQSRSAAYSDPLQPSRVPPPQSSESPNNSSLPNVQNHTFYPALPTTPQSFFPSANTSVNSGAPQYDEGDQGSTDHPPSRPTQYSGDGGTDNSTARSRACEACRSLKVRCEPDPENPEGTCKRCAKARRPCVVTVPNRKRQKKTDSRVAELERKIDALTASLHASQGHNTGGRTDSGADHQSSSYPPPDQSEPATGGWMGQVPGGQDGVFRQSMRGIPTPPAALGSKRKRSEEVGNYVYALQTGSLTSPPGSLGMQIVVFALLSIDDI